MQVPRKLKDDVSEGELDAIAAAVGEAETQSSGEIRVHIVRSLLPLETPRTRALRMFGELQVDATSSRAGVLLFVAMKPRCFEIVVDVGLQAKVEQGIWDDIAEEISESIVNQGFGEGLCAGIRRIGQVLAEHFPRLSGDVNELPDRPTIER